MEPSWVPAAEAFRELLRTERYPVGSEFSGITEIRKATGVSHATAQRALDYLADQGEVLIRPGNSRGSIVLPPPEHPLGTLNEINRIMTELGDIGERLHRAIRSYQKSRRTERAQRDNPETKDEAS